MSFYFQSINQLFDHMNRVVIDSSTHDENEISIFFEREKSFQVFFFQSNFRLFNVNVNQRRRNEKKKYRKKNEQSNRFDVFAISSMFMKRSHFRSMQINRKLSIIFIKSKINLSIVTTIFSLISTKISKNLKIVSI